MIRGRIVAAPHTIPMPHVARLNSQRRVRNCEKRERHATPRHATHVFSVGWGGGNPSGESPTVTWVRLARARSRVTPDREATPRVFVCVIRLNGMHCCIAPRCAQGGSCKYIRRMPLLALHGTDISPIHLSSHMGYTWLADWEGGCAGQAFVGWLYLEGSTCDLSPTHHPIWMADGEGGIWRAGHWAFFA